MGSIPGREMNYPAASFGEYYPEGFKRAAERERYRTAGYLEMRGGL